MMKRRCEDVLNRPDGRTLKEYSVQDWLMSGSWWTCATIAVQPRKHAVVTPAEGSQECCRDTPLRRKEGHNEYRTSHIKCKCITHDIGVCRCCTHAHAHTCSTVPLRSQQWGGHRDYGS